MRITITLLLCFIFCLIARVIPQEWQYLFGYTAGAIVTTVSWLMNDK